MYHTFHGRPLERHLLWSENVTYVNHFQILYIFSTIFVIMAYKSSKYWLSKIQKERKIVKWKIKFSFPPRKKHH